MRFIALLTGLVLLCGCDSPIVKDDFMTLAKIKKTKKFADYEIAIGPVALKGLTSSENDPNAPTEDETIAKDARYVVPADWQDRPELEFPGPMRITREVNAVIRMETEEVFHRRVKIGDKYFYFKLTEGAKGYGFKFVSVRNKENELGIIILRTAELVPSWEDPANRVGQGVSPNLGKRKGKGKRDKSKKEESEKAEASEDSDDKDESDDK